MICDKFTSSYLDGRCFVAITYPFSKHDALLVEDLRLDELVKYIQDRSINKAYVQHFSEFSFLLQCQSLEHIAIELRMPFNDYSQLKRKTKIQYDLSPLEQLSGLLSLDLRENERCGSKAQAKIDICKLPLLQQYSGDFRFTNNLFQGINLRSLRLIHLDHTDFSELSHLINLDTLHLSFSKMESLKGCSSLSKLQCLYLHNNRSLTDISDLRYVSQSLKALRIENCSNIQDYSVLQRLNNLELLELSGKASIPDLSFIRNMPNLKTLLLSVNVLDGDLSLCDKLTWVYSEYNRKHYNRKDRELPKDIFYHGNENIDEWRRFE